MWDFQWIKGLAFGLEYADIEELGFVINIDLGIFRATFYADVEPEEE